MNVSIKPKVAILVPCYKRPEYTKLCIKSLEDAQKYKNVDFYLYDDNSGDNTTSILTDAALPKYVVSNSENMGLRNILIDFFDKVRDRSYDYLAKVDNDCTVPRFWLNRMLDLIDFNNLDIASPNVIPSNAAFKYGKEDKEGSGYRPTEIIGGVWVMRASLINDLDIERLKVKGITGAIHIMNRIRLEEDPKMGWIPDVVFQDIGHWSGEHPEHIKSEEHERYSIEVGRKITWKP